MKSTSDQQRQRKIKRSLKQREKAAELPQPVDLSALAGREISARAGLFKRILIALKHPGVFWSAGWEAAWDAEQPMIADPRYRESLALPLHAYLRRSLSREFRSTISWRGVPTLKVVSDLWVYQEILHCNRPDFVVEIGCHYGGSTLFIADVLEAIGHGQVVSVDLSRDVFYAEHERISQITGDAGDPEVCMQVANMVRGKSVMLIHDADHRYEAVKRDLGSYAPLVTEGQFLIVEDGVVDLFDSSRCVMWEEGEGPRRAIEEFLAERPGEFEVDRGAERFLVTTNPGGFLRRRKSARS